MYYFLGTVFTPTVGAFGKTDTELQNVNVPPPIFSVPMRRKMGHLGPKPPVQLCMGVNTVNQDDLTINLMP